VYLKIFKLSLLRNRHSRKNRLHRRVSLQLSVQPL